MSAGGAGAGPGAGRGDEPPPQTSSAQTSSPRTSSPRPSRLRTSPWRWVVRAASAVLMGLGIWLIVIPQWREAVQLLPRLEHVPIPLLVVAALAQAGSLLCYSAMTMLMVGSGLGYGTSLRIDLVDLAVNHTVPGGGGVAAAARFRLFTRAGIPPARALAAATVEVTASNLALGALFLVGLALAAGTAGITGADITAGIAVAALVLAAAATGWLVSRRSAWLIAVAARLEERLPPLRHAHLSALVTAAHDQLEHLRARPSHLALSAACAVANWLLDAASLWLVLAALGFAIAPGPLLAAYGAATILAQLPITPGGIGLVEGVLVPALAAFGVPAGTALLGVLGWRALEYWLPIPLGGLAALSLRAGRGRGQPASRP